MSVQNNGTPLEDIFDPYQQGTKQCPAGEISEGGADIRDKYAPLSVGSKASDIGVKIGGVHITNYFAAKGTAEYLSAPPWNNQLYAVTSGTPDSTDIFEARCTMNFLTDGTYEVVDYSEGAFASSGIIDSGGFLPAGANPSDYEVRATVISGNNLTINEISSYQPLTSTLTIQQSIIAVPVNIRQSEVKIEVRKIGTPTPVVSKATLYTQVNA